MNGNFDAETDWVEMISIANDFLVGPHLYRCLQDSGRAGEVDPEALAYLGHLDAANVERNHTLRGEAVELARRLSRSRIHPLFLKGAAMLLQCRDVADTARMMGDIDLLIRPDEVPVVVEILGDLGYEQIDRSARGHSPGNYWKPGNAGVFDLHASLPFRLTALLSEEDVRQHSRWISVQGVDLCVPDASLHLVMNICHEMIHDQALYSGVTELRYLLDLKEMVGRGGDIDWDWIRKAMDGLEFRLSLELQDRMAQDLLGHRLFPGISYSRIGGCIHFRRILKTYFELAGRIEWSFVRRVLFLPRSWRLRPGGRP